MRYRSLYEVAMVSHKSLSQCHFLSCIFTSDTAALPTSGYLSTPSLCSSWCIHVKHSSFPHPKPSFLSTSPPTASLCPLFSRLTTCTSACISDIVIWKNLSRTPFMHAMWKVLALWSLSHCIHFCRCSHSCWYLFIHPSPIEIIQQTFLHILFILAIST